MISFITISYFVMNEEKTITFPTLVPILGQPVHIYCISLRKDVKKQERIKATIFEMFKLLRDAGSVRVADDNLESLYKSAVTMFLADKPENPDIGEKERAVIGCRMSHQSVIRDAVKNRYPNILVLEDDASLTNINYLSVSPYASKEPFIPPDWDMIYLGYNIYKGYRYSRHLLKTYQAKTTHAYMLSARCFNQCLSQIPDWDGPIDDYYSTNIQSNRASYAMFPIWFVQSPGFSTTEQRETDYVSVMLQNAEYVSKVCYSNLSREIMMLQSPSKKRWKNSTVRSVIKQFTQVDIHAVSDYDYILVIEKGMSLRLKYDQSVEQALGNIKRQSDWDVLMLSDYNLPSKAYFVRKSVWDMTNIWDNARIRYVYPPVYTYDGNPGLVLSQFSTGTAPLHSIKPPERAHLYFPTNLIFCFYINDANINAERNVISLVKELAGRQETIVSSLFFICGPFGDKKYRKTQFKNIFLIDHSLYNHLPPHTVVAQDFRYFIEQHITDYVQRVILWITKNTNELVYTSNIISCIPRLEAIINTIDDQKISALLEKNNQSGAPLVHIPLPRYSNDHINGIRKLQIDSRPVVLVQSISALQRPDFIKMFSGWQIASNKSLRDMNNCNCFLADNINEDDYWYCLSNGIVMVTDKLIMDTPLEPAFYFTIDGLEKAIHTVMNPDMRNLYNINVATHIREHSSDKHVEKWLQFLLSQEAESDLKNANKK
jgi:GR25 family glycosyltransferase involved in LPS biosynthesis